MTSPATDLVKRLRDGCWVGQRISHNLGMAMEEAAALLEAQDRVVKAAEKYRKAEQDGTPRMWRGKDLHDLSAALDMALEALSAEAAPI